MTARNHIPVNRDDAEIIPPDLGVETQVIPGSGKNPTLALGRTRAPRQSSTDCRGNLTLDRREHSKVAAEAGDMLADNLPDQSDTLVIPINLGGIRGAITARFIDFRPFNHAGRTSRVCQK